MGSKYLYNFDKLEGESDYELQAVRIALALERDNLEAYLEEEKPVTTKSSNTINDSNTIEVDTENAFESFSKRELANIAKKEAKKVSAILKSIYYDRPLLYVIYIVKPFNIQIVLKKLYLP